jgi:hypothetical protein
MMSKLFCNWECLIMLGSFVVTINQRPIFYGKFKIVSKLSQTSIKKFLKFQRFLLC